ncbi:hypothetical protein AB0H87_26335, partial [Asanoa sp. NPDC050611]
VPAEPGPATQPTRSAAPVDRGSSVPAQGSGTTPAAAASTVSGSAPVPAQSDGSDFPTHTSALPGEEAERPPAAGSDEVADPGPLPRRESPRFYTVIGFLLVLAASAVVGMRVAAPAYAAAPCPKPADTAAPKPGETTAPTPTPTPTEEKDDPGIIEGIIDGITGIFTGGSDEKQGEAAAPTPTPSEATKPPAGDKPEDCASAPGGPAAEEEEPQHPEVPLLAADGSVPSVNNQPSLLTGTKLTMWGLRIEGIYPMDTPAGEVRALKFTMSRSAVETFALKVPQGGGNPLLFKSGTLTVSGDVAFYATRFVGRIAGIKLTLTPSSPLPPDGIPLTIPKISFTDPQIQLMYVSCDQLLAPTLDEGFTSA